jgi:ankyrin repeat protein
VLGNKLLSDIFSAIRNADLDLVKKCLRNNPDCVKAREELDRTPLHTISSQGKGTLPVHVEIAELLIAHGADVNARSLRGWTPILCIAVNGSKQSVGVGKCLIDHGADLDAKDLSGSGWQSLWQHGQEVLELLTKKNE